MKHLRSLNKYFLRYRTTLILGILFILLSNAATVYVPIIIKDAINDLQKTVTYDALIGYAALVVIAAIVAGVFRFFIRETIIVVSRKIEYDLRQDFWEHIQRLSQSFFQSRSTGDIMAHATNDITSVRMFIGPAVMYSIDTAVRLIIVIVIMLTISVEITLISLIPLPFLSILVYFVGKKIHKRSLAVREKFSELTTKAQENFSGIRVIKSYLNEAREIASFDNLNEEYLERNMHLVKIQAIFRPILFLIVGISIIIAIWLGGVAVIEKDLLLGDVTALVMYLGILIWPMIALGWVVNIIQQAEASMQRLNSILQSQVDVKDSDETDSSITDIKGEVTFKHVSYRYREDFEEVLKDVNLTIPAGSTVAIMGYTGSGKTTLLNLIPRLFDISGGDLLIDGRSIKTIPLETLRKNIGFVQQETFLFSDTIAQNLCYGLGEVNEEKMLKAASIAQFDKDVADFPKKYETFVGERGITLSGGQKQRCTLARAIVIEPKILILDDSLSAIDTKTEEEILANLRTFMKGRTSLIVSHRVSTVKDADKIIVLDDGTIAEEGTHEELIERNGIYADLYYKQLLEKEIEDYH
jgi:ATP-binding cassette subfamily B protein